MLPLLKDDPDLTELVDPGSIHPSTVPANPAWPFTRFDAPISRPLDGSCFAGAIVDFLLHGFAKARLDLGQVVETAEDHAARIGSTMKQAVHNRRVAIEGGSVLLTVQSVRLLQDGAEAGAYHSALQCQARVLAE